MTTTEVKKFSDISAVIEAVASAFISTVADAQRERGIAKIVLTGGGAGIGVLKYLRTSTGGMKDFSPQAIKIEMKYRLTKHFCLMFQ